MKLFVVFMVMFLLLPISFFNPIPLAEEEIVPEVVNLNSHISTPVTMIVNEPDVLIPVEEELAEVTRPEINVPLSEDLQDHIWKLCQHYDMSYELVLALIKAESEFKSDVVSYNNSSLGLFQLNKNTYPSLAKELGIKNFNVFNPKHNSRAGIYYLVKIREDLLKKGLCDEEILPIMLITYHRGKTGAKKYISRNGVTSKYVNKIMKQKFVYEVS